MGDGQRPGRKTELVGRSGAAQRARPLVTGGTAHSWALTGRIYKTPECSETLNGPSYVAVAKHLAKRGVIGAGECVP
jgi:hypothetical protein